MDIVGLVAVLGAFGIPLYAIKTRSEERKRKHELESGGGKGGADAKLILEENKLLRERVENLETIVCSVDFELNKKLAKLVDEHRSLALPAAPGPMPEAPAPAT